MSTSKNRSWTKITNYLSRQIPTFPELILVLFFAVFITGLLTYTDIEIFDKYTLRIIRECHPENQSVFCSDQRSFLELPSDAQIEIGNAYWAVQQNQTLALIGFFIGLKIIFVWLGKGRQFISGTVILTALLYGATVGVFFASGWLDYGYYTLRGTDVPEELPWLNSAGLFNYTKLLGSDPNNVESSDLFFTMFVGASLIILGWLFLIYKGRVLKSEARSMGFWVRMISTVHIVEKNLVTMLSNFLYISEIAMRMTHQGISNE